MKTSILALCVLTTGCVSLDTSVDNLRDKAAESYDSALELAERIQCNDASVGSIKRRYGKSVASAQMYNEWCNNSGVIEIGQ